MNENEILAALRDVQDPDLNRDVVSLGFVKDLKIDGGHVTFTLELATPTCPANDRLVEEARAAVAAVSGVTQVEVNVTVNVTSSRTPRSHNLIPQVRNTIAVASGKGGVGKSTVAANLAVALARTGVKVGLMDTDVYGPSIPLLMGSESPPQILAGEQRMLPPVEYGVKLISMAYFLPKEKAVIWRGPMLHKMIQQFLGDVEWGELDYLIMDLPPGTGDIQLSLCQTIPLTGAAIVSTPQDLALTVASKAIAMFQQLKVPILGIIENMSFYVCPHCNARDDIFGHGGAREASQEMGIPFLGEIPLSSEIRVQSDRGQPMAMGPEDSPITKAYCEASQSVAAQVSIANSQSTAEVSIEA